jgi:hypothetical protein
VGAEAVGDLGRITRFILAAIKDDPDLPVAAKGLKEVRVEIHLSPGHHDEPSLGGLGGVSLG